MEAAATPMADAPGGAASGELPSRGASGGFLGIGREKILTWKRPVWWKISESMF
jgi:hypothetical protein